jgi:predicted NodU family carbamoyl transferase
MEGDRIEDYDLDALVRRFNAAVARALSDDRSDDAADFLVAEQVVCVLRGDFLEGDGGA